ncbi:rod shape-determining protein MreD [Cuneatibacter caecimuris]|uniref:Rod shape-determining protein MreD n=1 Tax=Cuneatibacter caecimuris TaxID=1796618 RepID=A0A4Q7P0W7_9FIRM|nr:rod shape-determining protein MreD [Cuneatibacter caecimuris]RZS92938.1 rod shape-determining protein MreD [Cuneatibacter caecimuris]
MRRVICTAALIVAAFLLQTTVFTWIPYLTAVPNLLLIITFSFGPLHGSLTGLIAGCASGLLMDLSGSDVIGYHALVYMYLGYINGKLYQIVTPDTLLLPFLLCIGNEAAYHIYIYLFSFLLKNQLSFSSYASGIILPELIGTLLLTFIIYGCCYYLNKWLEKHEKRSAAKFV